MVTYHYDAGGERASKRGRDIDVTCFGLDELERRGMQLHDRAQLSQAC